ncbi:DNA mismatch repair protein MLH1-like isoform X1 [Dioscorea cayenensis subsp. rotundata]|uniref:DNA mismatch repair protein MLH1-like isoform X1 n=1 Tax=Dioscorea cayennensis subsp. rotundata TaxID=55577 RepID=A0AB40BF31_DIOCR|nr:DNA mismatch repair protein MLH1-like isoform X1 [Dioscorea cayenensis subsp. rotundata]
MEDSSSSRFLITDIASGLVECAELKRAIEIVYSATLPKASKPFIYVSINLSPEDVDIHIHPAKGEVSLVSLLNQDGIADRSQNTIESKLMSANTTRTFLSQEIDIYFMNVLNVS